MSSRNMCLLPRATLHSDSEHLCLRNPKPDSYKIAVRLGVIYDSKQARMHKNTTTNKWMLLLFDFKISYNKSVLIRTFNPNPDGLGHI